MTKLFKDGLICLHDQYRSNIGQSVFVPKVEEAVLERGSIDDEKHDFSSECRNILKLFPHADQLFSRCHAHEGHHPTWEHIQELDRLLCIFLLIIFALLKVER